MLDKAKRTRFSLILLAVLVLVSAYFWSSIPGAIEDGTYTAVVAGFGGDMEVAVTFADGDITEIDIVSDSETPFIAANAFNRVIPAIIESQSTDVEVVSGATVTSEAIIAAVQQVINENR